MDEMMMRNVRTATLNADCVLIVVDACQQPEEVLELPGLILYRIGIAADVVLLAVLEQMKPTIGSENGRLK